MMLRSPMMYDAGLALRAAFVGSRDASPSYSNVALTGVLTQASLPVVHAVSTMTANSAGGVTQMAGFSVTVDQRAQALEQPDFDAEGGVFTAPMRGLYLFGYGANVSAVEDGLHPGALQLRQTTTDAVLSSQSVAAELTTDTVCSSATHVGALDAGQGVYLTASNCVVRASPPTYLHAQLICPLPPLAPS